MALEVVVSRTASRQLAELLTAIALESPSGARRLEAAVRELFDRLSRFPESFPAISGDQARIGLAARRIHVLYRVVGGRVMVTRIVYAGYDLRRLIEE